MHITPIAYISSPYKQKFAIPRQPSLVPEAIGEVVFEEEFADPNGLRDLERFSHIWLIFHFHETAGQGWTPMVQPPRLGGKRKVGVFASRSMFRPNGLGLSVVENRGWEQQGGQLILRVAGIDLLDGTPIVDIKPYLPYADAVPRATGGWAESAPDSGLSVAFADAAEGALIGLAGDYPGLRELIVSVLRQDPRPAWRRRDGDDKQYGMSLHDLNIKWRIEDGKVLVLQISRDR